VQQSKYQSKQCELWQIHLSEVVLHVLLLQCCCQLKVQQTVAHPAIAELVNTQHLALLPSRARLCRTSIRCNMHTHNQLRRTPTHAARNTALLNREYSTADSSYTLLLLNLLL
jgi:hypothetical protein